MGWVKKEVGADLEYIIYKDKNYPYEFSIFIKEDPAGNYKVIWAISNCKNQRKISRIQSYYTSKNYEKNKTNAEYTANILKTKLINENPLKHGKKLLLSNLKWL